MKRVLEVMKSSRKGSKERFIRDLMTKGEGEINPNRARGDREDQRGSVVEGQKGREEP